MNINTKKSYGGHIAIKILFVVFFLLCANTLFAQIQTKILGCRVGTSTANEVMAILNQQGYTVYYLGQHSFFSASGQIRSCGEDYNIRGSILFGGICWDGVTFTFVGGKLARVSFVCIEKDGYSKLLSDLKNKYSRYYEKHMFFEGFRDGYTEISLITGGSLSLAYSNIKLQDAMYGGAYSGGASDL